MGRADRVRRRKREGIQTPRWARGVLAPARALWAKLYTPERSL